MFGFYTSNIRIEHVADFIRLSSYDVMSQRYHFYRKTRFLIGFSGCSLLRILVLVNTARQWAGKELWNPINL